MFAMDPASLLKTLRNDNDKIERTLASYLATDSELLSSVRKLVADAPTTSKRAIGAGIRRAEMQCTAPKPEVARKIISFIRNLNDATVYAGYVSVTEEPEPQYTTGQPRVTPRNPGKSFTGEWNTEIADPFESVPLPQ